MTTARDQTREAIYSLRLQPYEPFWKEAAADAASDVWEPIVRDLLPFVRLYARRFGSGETAVLAAEEALGEA